MTWAEKAGNSSASKTLVFKMAEGLPSLTSKDKNNPYSTNYIC